MRSPGELGITERRSHDLQALAGVAVVFVLAAHVRTAVSGAPLTEQASGHGYFAFWPGVDLLLAIAAFVGARALAARLDAARGLTGKLRATVGFWLASAWRVLPSAWLWLALTVACAFAFNASGVFGAPGPVLKTAATAVLNVENLVIARHARATAPGATYPFWALSLAAQFFLVLPLVIVLSRPPFFWAVAAAIAVQLFHTRSPADPLSFMRTDALLIGASLAVWTRGPVWRLFEPTGLVGSKLARFAAPALLLFLMAAAGSSVLQLVPFNMGLAAALSGVLVWLASYEGGYVLTERRPLKRVLAWIGARAIGLYFAHGLAFLAAREIWFRLDPAALTAQPPHMVRFLATALPLVAVLGELNYRLVERPLARLWAKLAHRPEARADAAPPSRRRGAATAGRVAAPSPEAAEALQAERTPPRL